MPVRLYSIAVGERGRGEGGREITLSEKKGEVPLRLYSIAVGEGERGRERGRDIVREEGRGAT